MVSSYFKPLNIICVLLYIAFMGVALDSQVVDALVLYVSEQNSQPVYVSGTIEKAETTTGSKTVKPLVAIRYRSTGETSTTDAQSQAAENSENATSAIAQKQDDQASENQVTSIDMVTTEAANAKSDDSTSFEIAFKSAAAEATTRKEPAKVEAIKPKARTESSPQATGATESTGNASALTYINSISKNKWEYATLLDRYIVRYDSETYVVLTIRPSLQKMLENIFEKYSTRIGAAVIQDPATGEILAMTSSHRGQVTSVETDEFKTDNWVLKPTFPVASIFKIITGAAALDTGKITTDSNFLAWGKTYMTVWKAFANSHNGVFGRIARKIGRDVLEKYTQAFGFNKTFFFDLPVGKSLAALPNDQIKLGQAAAGLNRDFLVSPIHVASIVSTVLNRGKTMKPYLVDYVVRKNKVIFRRKPFQLAQPIKANTARNIYKMMYGTTAVGTGKKGFGGYRSCPELAKICGGKTGTLTGASPHYLFTWFGGFTKATGRDLCIVTLAGQPNHSGVKASSIAGQISYELYMKRQGKDPAAVAKKSKKARR
ncbi:MAG: penicillin-binding transpeptidase domain-containing protein [Candidatus Riflebacteria bacterium]|jgi:membrane carboxypeptidase/penicillin-binding protein|nr:penicillin-binding transpeptidase domain-containing protein [Candidatus Riflebacteria bacterium]